MSNTQPLDEWLAGVEERVAAATKGPWWYAEEHGAVYVDDDAAERIADVCGGGRDLDTDANGVFIANSYADLERALAEIKRLSAPVTITDEMVERAARAAYVAWDDGEDDWNKLTKSWHEDWRGTARAALKAALKA